MQEREREREVQIEVGGQDKGNLFPASRGVTAWVTLGFNIQTNKQTNKQTPLDGPVEEEQLVSLSVENCRKLAFDIEVNKQSNCRCWKNNSKSYLLSSTLRFNRGGGFAK